MISPVEIHDSSLRDSIGDFVTLHLKSVELTEILGLMDRIGFASFDAFGGAVFMPTMTILGEDPWQRLRIIRDALRHTPLKTVLRGRMLFGRWIAPESTVRATIRHLKNIGVDRLKIADAGLDPEGAALVVRMAKDAGFIVSGAVSVSWGELPWIDDILAETASLFEAAGADAISLQDPYGLFTPAHAAETVRRHRELCRLPLVLHFHDVNLLGVASLAAGIDAGASGADTTLSTLSWNYSPPQAESLVMALRGTSKDSGLDIGLLEKAAEWFEQAKIRKGFKYKAVYSIDHYLLRGEMPVAMRRSLSDTLREAGRMDLIEACWEKLPAIWRDLGRPPLLSPMVQAITAQALENVSSGEQYGNLDYRVSAYLRGEFGPVRQGARSDLLAKASRETTAKKSLPLDVDNLSPDAYPSEDDRLTYAYFPALSDEFFRRRAKTRGDMPDTRFMGRGAEEEQTGRVPKRLVISRHGEEAEVALEGVGPQENGKRTLFLRIGGETAKIEVTSPAPGAPFVYTLTHHGKRHTFEFLEILHAGKRFLPVKIKEDGKEEELLYGFPRD